ncbi:MAG TPA: hypothetical protein VD994_09160, partial [Prosthecobacter sp.]|nr:hypothetical protein [Prosthecobacter sp.]
THLFLLPDQAIEAIRQSFVHLLDQQRVLREYRASADYDQTGDHIFAWADGVPIEWVEEFCQRVSSADSL